jgi:6,7-dimethyl-8-ribityllumazine synthase
MSAREGSTGRRDLRLCLVVSRFNEPITRRLEDGARQCLEAHDVDPENIDVVRVPGAWELSLGVRLIIRRCHYDGVIALGCVFRGETPHFEYISMGATVGLEALARETGVPVGFGLLTTEDGEQAMARAGGAKGNKGEETALAVLDMCDLAARLK